MRLVVGAASDIGRVRSNNEDSYLADDPLFAVADGMGGENAGEVASALALEVLAKMAGEGRTVDLTDWVREANREVWDRSVSDRSVAGMGTTLTAVLADGERLRLAHVGDSRAYLLRNGQLRRLTEDHTRVARMVREGTITEEQAARHPERNIITRALGISIDVNVDQILVDVRTGDRLLLCTDGLTGMVPEEELRTILQSAAAPEEAARKLIEAANEAGGADNVTAVVLDVLDSERPPIAAPASRRLGRAGVAALSVAGLLVIGLVLRQTGTWPFSNEASAPSPTSLSPSAPGESPEPILAFLRPGTEYVASATADMNGDGVPETVIASQGISGQGGAGSSSPVGPFLDVYSVESGGEAHVFDSRIHTWAVDAQTTVVSDGRQPPSTMVGGDQNQRIVFLDLIDFRGDGTPEVVVGIASVIPAGTLQIWVMSLSPEGGLHADYYQVLVTGGELSVMDRGLLVTPNTGALTLVEADPQTGRILVLGIPTSPPPATTPSP